MNSLRWGNFWAIPNINCSIPKINSSVIFSKRPHSRAQTARSQNLHRSTASANNTAEPEPPNLTNPKRVKKLTKFFGEDPPLMRLFLRTLGYEVRRKSKKCMIHLIHCLHLFLCRNMPAFSKRNESEWLSCRIWVKSVYRKWAYRWDHVCAFCKRLKFRCAKTPRCVLFKLNQLHRFRLDVKRHSYIVHICYSVSALKLYFYFWENIEKMESERF